MSVRPPKVVTFGELLLRLNPSGHLRIVQSDEFEVRYTGAEANVAVTLAHFGLDAYVVSKVPENEVGQACVNFLRRYGVKTDYVVRGGERLGLFYLEAGAAQRPSRVIYDRGHSAIRDAALDEFDWEVILDGADWFHFSGTAPALGDNVIAILEEGLSVAKRRGATVSCDLNYRAKLWSPEDANRTMRRLMPYVDVLLGNEEDAEKVFGIKAQGTDVAKGRLRSESYEDVAVQLAETFDVRYVAITLRESVSASVNRWGAMLFDGAKHYFSRTYEMNPVIDRVGGGDSFSGGLIYGLISGFDPKLCVEFATAASCLKHTIPGDLNLVSIAEVKALVDGDGSGRVQR
jgi:2-dehydro-3-deoxygluconokinase